MIGEELVQLLTPEGERVANSDYESKLGSDEIFGSIATWSSFVGCVTSRRHFTPGSTRPVGTHSRSRGGSDRCGPRARAHGFHVPTYREHGIAWCRGCRPRHAAAVSRDVNGGWDPQKYRHSVPTVVLGNQALNAVGYAMGVQRDGAEEAVMAFSATGLRVKAMCWSPSCGRRHSNTPTVFFCQNNQWGISTPMSIQSKIPLYHRAHGFWIPGHSRRRQRRTRGL